MKNKLLAITLLLSLFHHKMVFSQPDVIPPDPRSEVFTIFGDIPVSHTTGVPDISIPLFNLVSHGYTLPVTLRYHTALVKPPYDQTNIATGWVLEVGGNITQQCKGMNDLLMKRPDQWKTASDLYDQWDSDVESYLDRVNRNIMYDTQYDMFSYSLPGRTGKFILGKNVYSQLECKFLSEPLFDGELVGHLTTTTSGVNTYELQSIDIIDESGYKYVYAEEFINRPQEIEAYHNATRFMKEIRDPFDNQLFEFSYQTVTYPRADDYPISISYRVSRNPDYDLERYNCTDFIPDPYQAVYTRLMDGDWHTITVDAVKFDDGYLLLELSQDKTHIEGAYLYDKQDNLVKGYDFVFGTFAGEGYRYLDHILCKDENGNTENTYEFSYNQGMQAIINENIHTDYWGYLNGNNLDKDEGYIDLAPITVQNVACYPSTTGINIGSGHKDPNEIFAKYFTLESIKYPTGGKTDFVFELNKLGTDNYGGLRIKEIINSDEDDTFIGKKRYEYNYGEVNNGDVFPYNYSVTYKMMLADPNSASGYSDAACVVDTYNDYNFTRLGNNIPFYKHIAEYNENNDDIAANNGKIEYKYRFDNLDVITSLVYQNPHISFYNSNLTLPYIPDAYISEYRNWGNSLLRKKSVFERDGTTYNKVFEEEFDYEHQVSESFDNLAVVTLVEHRSISGGGLLAYYTERHDLLKQSTGSGNPDWTKYNQPYPDPVMPYDYTIKAGSYKLKQKITRTVFDGGTVLDTVDYIYDNGLDKYATKIETTSSSNKPLVTETTYPYDYSTSVFPSMVNKNIYNKPIQTVTYKDNKVTGSSLTTYKEDDGNYVPDESYKLELVSPLASIAAFNGTNAGTIYGTSPEVKFIGYNSQGKLTKALSKDAQYQYYLWAYNKQYPVARIVSSLDETVSVTVNDTELKKTDELADIKTDITYLEGLLGRYLGNNNYRVTLYTYKPLVGMTSKTGPNGITVYYGYDAFGRLEYIKDNDGKILKYYNYQYAGQ